MSGTPCRIIIEGNRLQAYARLFAGLSHTASAPPVAEQVIAAAQSVCQLGTATYDGKEVMTDAQQERAPVIMGTANAELAKVDFAKPITPEIAEHISAALVKAGNDLNSLLSDVLANP